MKNKEKEDQNVLENKKNKYLDFDDWKRQLSGNKSPKMRENETTLEQVNGIRGESMLFDKTSMFHRKAKSLGVPLPLAS